VIFWRYTHHVTIVWGS